MTPQKFVQIWTDVELSERAASQEHFIGLCRMLGQPAPAEYDSKGVDVTSGASAGARGGHGFADVWWKGKFAWEYKRKGKYKNLNDAYRQLLQYREALDNPPLLIVSDIARIEIHTNSTGTAKEVHTVALADFTEPAARQAPPHLHRSRVVPPADHGRAHHPGCRRRDRQARPRAPEARARP